MLLLVHSLQEGVPTIGILGCPNLPAHADDANFRWGETETEDNNQDTRGCIFVASQQGGCFQLPLLPGSPGKRVHVTPSDGSTMDTKDARFCIGESLCFHHKFVFNTCQYMYYSMNQYLFLFSAVCRCRKGYC